VTTKIAGREAESCDQELWLYFFLGVWRQRWKDRHTPIGGIKDFRTNPQGGR
jgi:hypothetical protein